MCTVRIEIRIRIRIEIITRTLPALRGKSRANSYRRKRFTEQQVLHGPLSQYVRTYSTGFGRASVQNVVDKMAVLLY